MVLLVAFCSTIDPIATGMISGTDEPVSYSRGPSDQIVTNQIETKSFLEGCKNTYRRPDCHPRQQDDQKPIFRKDETHHDS